MESDDIKNSSTLTLLAPLAPVASTVSIDCKSVKATNVERSNGVGIGFNLEQANEKFEVESKSLGGINIYQLPIPLEAVNAVTTGDLLQMSSSVVGVSAQRHSFMTAVGSDVVSCSDADVDPRSLSHQLSPHRQSQAQQPHLQTLNPSAYESATSSGGRISPLCYQGSSTYATLTPFQPLPPISTVSDKFNGMGFVFMQNHTSASDLNSYVDGTDVYTSYKYTEKDVAAAEMSSRNQAINCNGYDTTQNGIAMVMNGSGYLMTQPPARSNFQSTYSVYGHTAQDDLSLPVKSEMNGGTSLAGVDSLSSYDNISTIYTSNLMSTSLGQPKTVATSAVSLNVGHTPISTNGTISAAAVIPHRAPVVVDIRSQMRVGSPDQPSSSTDMRECDDDESSVPTDGSGGEEVNTRDVALRVSNELKKYSIPQAVFAQRVLGRSQGTLSDLLRNPKPWSKLKSGRETFRRMWKWLQEPEYQRMASLRIAGADVPGLYVTPDTVSIPVVKQQPTTCKRSREGTPVTSTQTSLSIAVTSQLRTPDIQQSAVATTLSGGGGGGGGGGGSTSASCAPKKPRMVFTEIQRRTLVAIFKEIKRPSKEIQATIAEQLGLKVSTVVNFFMNARRRSVDKYLDEAPASSSGATDRDAVSSTAGPSEDSLRQ